MKGIKVVIHDVFSPINLTLEHDGKKKAELPPGAEAIDIFFLIRSSNQSSSTSKILSG